MKEQNQDKQQKKQKGNTSPKHMSVKSILGGDILANDFFKRQTRLLILIMVLMDIKRLQHLKIKKMHYLL